MAKGTVLHAFRVYLASGGTMSTNEPFSSLLPYADPKVRDALVQAYINRQHRSGRVRIWFGDPKTGRAYQEEFDVLGYVGRTTGSVKYPILLNLLTSVSGPAISTSSVVRIDWTDGTATIYKHPKFHTGLEAAEVVRGQKHTHSQIGSWWSWDVRVDGAVVSSFGSEIDAKNWLGFMKGQRYKK